MNITARSLTIGTSTAILGFLLSSLPAAAQDAQSFSDVSPDNPVYEAVEFLRSQGIISGYDDGTFKPDKSVNRAEALKIIIAPLVSADQLALVTQTPFADIEEGAWYLPFVEAARQNEIIDGPPNKTKFLGGNTVITAEFLKMLELANKVNPQTFLGEIRLPLSSDVSNPDEWFYPYMRYALASSMIMIGQDGLLHPGEQLTRGDTALLLYRFLMYQQERRTQALLSETENEMIIVLAMLDEGNIDQAEFAAGRAILAARGAHIKRSDEPIIQGAVKIAEAFQEIVKAYQTGMAGQFANVVTLSGNAWNLAASARDLSPDLAPISEQVQKIATNMADSARAASDN
ncbi:S-layer homology domain-containing protein [Patescibacteria group bacterium]|nr:S-layer homology domain-containing protein [Patescibacteria group bacterium]